MMARRLLVLLSVVLFSTCTYALDEPTSVPVAKPAANQAPVTSAPAQQTPAATGTTAAPQTVTLKPPQANTVPAQPAPAQSKPLTTPAVPVKPLPVNPVPTTAAPAKPAIISPVQSMPLATPSVPAKPLPVKPLPTTAAPAKPITIAPALNKPLAPPATPAKPLPVKPLPTTAAPAKPLPVKPVPAQPAPVKPVPNLSVAAHATATPVGVADLAEKEDQHIDFKNELLAQTLDIEFFIRDNCPQCEKAKDFLEKLANMQPHLKIATRDVRKEPAAIELLKRMSQSQGVSTLDYPSFVVGGQLITGFSEDANTPQQILSILSKNNPESEKAMMADETCSTGKEVICDLIPPTPQPIEEKITVELLGYSIPLLQIGLPLLTIAMGILDGFNYASTWVLVMIISLLAPMKNRTLMLTLAGAFIAVQGIIYFAWMAAWFNLNQMVDISTLTQTLFAAVAFVAAVMYFKSYVHFGHSISISSHEITEPGIYTRIRKIVQADNFFTALAGTVTLAILVQVSEFTYKSFFPALYTHTLHLQQLGTLSNYAYLMLYDFAYMLDHIVVMIVGITLLNQQHYREREGRSLKFFSALAMFALCIYLFSLVF